MRNENMKKTVIGFVPVESPIYALHPVTRIFIFLAMGFIPLFIQMPEVNLALFLTTLLLFKIAKVDMKQLKKYLPMVITVACFISITYTIFPTKLSGEVPFIFLGMKFYKYSILWAICIYVRIMTLLFSSIFFFSTNRERDILVGLRCLKVPFAASYFLGLTLRSAGMFMEDYQIVREAEKARGLDMSSAPFHKKLTHFPMYMIPLFTLAIRRSEDISTGLYAKGTEIKGTYKGVKRPDYLRSLFVRTKKDFVVTGFIASLFVGVAVLSIMFHTFSLDNSLLNVWFGNVI